MSAPAPGWKSLAQREKMASLLADGKISQEYFDAQEQASAGKTLPARLPQIPKSSRKH